MRKNWQEKATILKGVEAVMNRIRKEKKADTGYSVGKDEPSIKG